MRSALFLMFLTLVLTTAGYGVLCSGWPPAVSFVACTTTPRASPP
jgi:hypothetical protein